MRRYQDIPTTERNAVVEAMLEDDNSWGDVAAALGYTTAARARRDYVLLKRRQTAALKGLSTHAVDFDARGRNMQDMRTAGMKWEDIAIALEYSCAKAAQRAHQKWNDRRLGVTRERKSRLSSLPEDVKTRRCLMAFMRDAGYSWDVIARTLGYSSGPAAARAYGKES